MLIEDKINELPKDLEQLRHDKATHIQNLFLVAARNLGIFLDSEVQLAWLTTEDNSQKLRRWLEEALQKMQAEKKDLNQLSPPEERDLARKALQYFFNWQGEVLGDAFDWSGDKYKAEI
ncbi:MAG TPA: hypothetical protein PKZ16_02540 [bacterium]|nr:hypothetical protein [bacterium]HPL95762.1 hypothetical protein [bacterium]